MLNGSTDTSTPSKNCCEAVGVRLGANVAGREVTEGRIGVGLPDIALIVFVGRGTGLVEGATDTDISHAIATTMNREMNKRGFFIVLCMAEFPFVLDHSSQERKTPLPLEEFSTGQVDR